MTRLNSFRLARPARLGLAIIGVSVSACTEPGPTAIDGLRKESGAPQRTQTSEQPSLVECPTNQTQQASATITILGGSVTVGGTRVEIPFGAVLLPVKLTLTVPASNYMEIDVTANDLEHFEFEKPVTVILDYSRCARGNIEKGPLSAWYINESNEPLENMNGIDDKVARTIRFMTGHLSGYAIAN
jgi:hypothetical protein